MRVFIILCCAFVLTACKQPAKHQEKPLPWASQSKELVVVTHNGPNTYYVDGTGRYAGMEYDLAELFAKSLGPEYKVKFLVVDNVSQIIPTLMSGRAHLAAADHDPWPTYAARYRRHPHRARVLSSARPWPDPP